MGRGDRRTRKGKIWRGSFGKKRPHKARVVAAAAAEPVAEKAPAKKAPAKKAAKA